MMRKSLLALGLVATVGFLLAGWRGYQGDSSPEALQQHLYVALGSSLLLLLADSAMAIYLVGTARVVRVTCRERGFEPALIAAARANVRRAVPLAAVAVLALLLAVIAGAGLLARYTPYWTHHALIYFALAAQVATLLRARVALREQDAIIADLDRRVGPAA